MNHGSRCTLHAACRQQLSHMHHRYSCPICKLHQSVVLTDKKIGEVHPCSRMQAFGPLHLSHICIPLLFWAALNWSHPTAWQSMAQHARAMFCFECQTSQRYQTGLPVSDRKGRALAWNLISFCPQSCHLLLQLIPANSPPARDSMSIFQTALLHTLQHLADFVCPLGMHASVETHTLLATG